jgi:hypothetical protein
MPVVINQGDPIAVGPEHTCGLCRGPLSPPHFWWLVIRQGKARDVFICGPCCTMLSTPGVACDMLQVQCIRQIQRISPGITLRREETAPRRLKGPDKPAVIEGGAEVVALPKKA